MFSTCSDTEAVIVLYLPDALFLAVSQGTQPCSRENKKLIAVGHQA